jgi:cellulose synthase (UDP-forming)
MPIALDEVGGFATETVTEDMHTAVKLQKLGYKSVYHPESLAYGVAATSYVEFLQQRLRWGHGNVQTLREEGLPFCKGLTLPQKICYTALGLVYFEGWSRLILYFSPAIVLLTGIAPIGDTRLFFWFFIPYFLSVYIWIEEFGRGSARFFVSEYMAMARFPVFILSTLGLVYKRKRFRITSKTKSEQIPTYLILPQLLIFVFNSSAFVVGIISPPEILVISMSGGTIKVICFWAAFNIILAASIIYSVTLKKQDTEENYFKIPLPINISTTGQENYTAEVCEISANNIIFTGIFEPTLNVGDPITCNLYLQDQKYSIDAKVESINSRINNKQYNITCSIDWYDINSRDSFNLKLCNCNWYRKFTLRDGFFKTPLEWLTTSLNPFVQDKALPIHNTHLEK